MFFFIIIDAQINRLKFLQQILRFTITVSRQLIL